MLDHLVDSAQLVEVLVESIPDDVAQFLGHEQGFLGFVVGIYLLPLGRELLCDFVYCLVFHAYLGWLGCFLRQYVRRLDGEGELRGSF